MAEMLHSGHDMGTPEGYHHSTAADPTEHQEWHSLMMGADTGELRERLSAEAQSLLDQLESSDDREGDK